MSPPKPPSTGLFSPGALNYAQRTTTTARGGQIRSGDLGPERYRVLGDIVTKLAVRYAAVSQIEDRKKKVFDDGQHVASSALGLAEHDYLLTKELSNFFRSDGEDILPPPDFDRDLGMGVSLAYGDFVSTKGKRRSYREVVSASLDNYMAAKRKNAPSPEAEGRADVRMREGKLKALISADIYDQKRRGVKLANNMNTVVRAYKETIAKTKGFSSDVFASHLEALVESVDSASGIVDAGQSFTMLREAGKDLIGVAISESVTGGDNDAALRVLGQGPLADTELLRKQVSGLPASDRALLAKYKGLYSKEAGKKYALGSPLPKDRQEYFSWALGQVDKESMAKLQERAVNAFRLRTDRTRKELDQRIDGGVSAISYIGLQDAGFRESLLTSFDKAAVDLNVVYPKDIFPAEHSDRVASLLVARAMVSNKDILNTVRSSDLAGYSEKAAASLHQKIVDQFPGRSLAHLPILTKTKRMLEKFTKGEAVMRVKDPYGALQQSEKLINKLESRLSSGEYSNNAERLMDQKALETAVLSKARDLGMTPSFLGLADVSTLSSLVKMGNLGDAYTEMKRQERKLGPSIFNNYVRPHILSMDDMGALRPLAIINDPQAAELLLGGILTYKSRMATNAKIGDEDVRKHHIKMVSALRGSKGFKAIDQYILDTLGSNADAAQLREEVLNAMGKLAVSHLVSGVSDVEAARAVNATVAKGIGEVVGDLGEADERSSLRIIPPLLSSLVTPPELEQVFDILYKDSFLRTSVVPHITLPEAVTEGRDKEAGIGSLWDLGGSFDSREDNFIEIMEDRDRVRWILGSEGLIPVDMHPIYQGHYVPYPSKDGGFFSIPYTEVPNILKGQR